MAVDGSEMVWEIDIGTGSDHGDEREEDGVCNSERKSIYVSQPSWETYLGLKGRHTEDEFLSGRQHIDCEGHLILINLQADPADHRIEKIEEGFHGEAADVQVDMEASEVNN